MLLHTFSPADCPDNSIILLIFEVDGVTDCFLSPYHHHRITSRSVSPSTVVWRRWLPTPGAFPLEWTPDKTWEGALIHRSSASCHFSVEHLKRFALSFIQQCTALAACSVNIKNTLYKRPGGVSVISLQNMQTRQSKSKSDVMWRFAVSFRFWVNTIHPVEKYQREKKLSSMTLCFCRRFASPTEMKSLLPRRQWATCGLIPSDLVLSNLWRAAKHAE